MKIDFRKCAAVLLSYFKLISNQEKLNRKTKTYIYSLLHVYVMFSCTSNMNSFIGLVFFHDLCICVMDFSHCIALYFVFRLYDSALAIILLKAT